MFRSLAVSIRYPDNKKGHLVTDDPMFIACSRISYLGFAKLQSPTVRVAGYRFTAYFILKFIVCPIVQV